MHWNLVKLRMDNGLNFKQMGEIAGISGDSYSRREKGVTDFRPREMYHIAKHFNLKVSDIFLKQNIRNTDIEVLENEAN
ncbi:hypothetical protein AQ616_19025 [Oceanobacillus sp. E9]|uniref:helix-turn-helix transcriptional regulator n=1 Tax=Oceanobacillus sp. E9 TaxID=1742575 RepID=UPI00084E83CF|nr:helix-turn-helix transcriptional regulator [Oceanobacillus sp. E9]OEH55931.1 hypothetical protein AQ616_19025 [Oceanobacillus sp. E9]